MPCEREEAQRRRWLAPGLSPRERLVPRGVPQTMHQDRDWRIYVRVEGDT
jgi:hypothetical protein